ncbi:MAG: DUF6470 family protein [Eubacteriales bacterium]|jgi:hypothetical protein
MHLLRITTIPLKLKMNIQMAKLQISQGSAQMRQSSEDAKLLTKQSNVKVNINTYGARKRLGLLNSKDFIKAAAVHGEQKAEQAMAQYSELGNRLAMAHKGVTAAQAAYRAPIEVPSTETAFQPGAGAQFSVVDAKLEIQYAPAKLNLNWDNSHTSLEYVPGGLEIEVEQYPRIEIEYMGSPSYVPPSAEPGYTEEDI